MLASQDGKCAICRADLGQFSLSENLMAIDHDHATGAVRGLLCRRCNYDLAVFRDSTRNLARAAAYLTRSRATGGEL